MNLEELSPFCRVMHPCVGNVGDEKNPQYVVNHVYPAFPWRMDGTDHSKDNPKFFYQQAEMAGLITHVRAVDMEKDEPPITYGQWCEKHRLDPDFVNNLEAILNEVH